MGLYNMLHGMNPMADQLLACLGLTRSDVGRFRDAYVSEGKIAVYTRNGGGNRECWNAWSAPDDFDFEHCTCVGCTMENIIPKHPNYLYDEDDQFDNTYATIYYSFPERYKEWLTLCESGEWNPDQKWLDYFRRLENDDLSDVERKAVKELGDAIAGLLADN